MKGRRLEKEIERLSGHIILIGYGRVGKEAAEEWSSDNLVVIEQDHETAVEAQNAGHLTIEGDSTNDATLLNAGIERASGIMIATADMAHNVLISLTARELNPNIIISARGDDNRSEARLKRAGANMVVLPHKIGGRRMAAFLKHPHVIDFFDMVMQRDDLSLRLQEFRIKPGSNLIGKTLKESDIRKNTNGTLVMAIRTQIGALLVPAPPNYSIEENDLLIGLGTDEALGKMETLTGRK
jgi:voltage-gated potassium channel